jgi:hypothetical protein
MLVKSFGLHFSLKKAKTYEKDTIPIYLRITVDGIPKELSTKEHAIPAVGIRPPKEQLEREKIQEH